MGPPGRHLGTVAKVGREVPGPWREAYEQVIGADNPKFSCPRPVQGAIVNSLYGFPSFPPQKLEGSSPTNPGPAA